MFLLSRRKIKYIAAFLSVCFLAGIQDVHAADSTTSIFSNALALALLLVMALLLIVIGVLAFVLLGAADINIAEKKRKTQANGGALPAAALAILLCCATAATAQDGAVAETKAAATIGGLAPFTFYIMNSVIFLEFLVIMVLLFNIRQLLRKEKARMEGLTREEVLEQKRLKISWWGKINKMKPVSQEGSLLLEHEYDGIRELDNRLPPWWLYGFYVTIIAAGIYLWRFHVSHTAMSSTEEYIASVEKADMEIKEYLKKKGDAVDENTVTVLSGDDDLAQGKNIFQKSCASCHKETGAGDVGPNLTDDYWLHGNDIKSVFKTIRYGINAMPQWQNTYSNKQIAQVASYVKSLHGSNPPSPKPPQGIEIKEAAATANADSTGRSATAP